MAAENRNAAANSPAGGKRHAEIVTSVCRRRTINATVHFWEAGPVYPQLQVEAADKQDRLLKSGQSHWFVALYSCDFRF